MNTEQYEEYMGSVQNFCGTRFLGTRFDLIRFLECDGSAAIVLTWYVNLLMMKDGKVQDRKTLKENDMFFRCPAKDMEKELRIAHDKRIRVNKCLEKLGFLEMDHRAGNITWVKVNAKKLNEVQAWDRENNQPAEDSEEIRSRETRNQKSGNPKSEVGKPEDSPPPEEASNSGKTSKSMKGEESSKNTSKTTNNTVEGCESSADPRSARPASGHRNSENFSKPSSKQSSRETEKETISYEKSKKQSNHQGDPQSGRSAPLPRKEPDPVKELTTWFHSELKKKRLDSPTTKSLKGWVVLFVALTQKIQERDKVNLEGAISYIKSILIDHLANSHDEWQPQAWCAKKVCDKWECIERQWRSRQSGNGSSNGQAFSKCNLFDKRTKEWFGNLPYEYDHPTKDGVVVKLYSSGLWYEHFHIIKDGEKLSTRKRHDANEGDFPPPPP